jgi:hypothetical protein
VLCQMIGMTSGIPDFLVDYQDPSVGIGTGGTLNTTKIALVVKKQAPSGPVRRSFEH